MSPERFARINELLDRRQPDLTLCLESVHKNHNLSALIRTADAVGLHEVHAIWFDRKGRVKGGTAMGSQQWVRVNHHDSTEAAVAQLKAENKQVLVTNLSAQAVDFRSIDYTRPTAIIFGQEKHGVSEQALQLADQHVVIPMVGMAQSLNVSVAAAAILYEAQRQRENAGMYQSPQLSAEERHRVLFEGGHPIFAKICRRKKLPYPVLDAQGQIVADASWWQAVRSA
ncbi:tRNA (guanosine(18)-2'-O)-methyltransferase TrmH [Pseudidiomarina insulisalsae]|uniref:tRNA (guanosine(18)-2'-O)-methyltransferase n=1 Tax=Pseudidiomarina insulisalsae TaxID=575789 RepID=A0A432YQP4_9GAMM|nr:tRNA (guanosine(18)-2'-O)-methyltransferase TrmH [Pseudidiomarina insulisalsae]RUO63596.1 tRNA (guanosine(18)-2'-O)-methyltransferase TrmH [Pseudidiomarina insulisalsae]